MFGNLIASIGLACAIGTPKITTVQRANYNYTIQGAYNILHVEDNEPYFTGQLFNEDLSIYYDNSLYGYGEFWCVNPNQYTDFYATFENIDLFELYYIEEYNLVVLHIDYYQYDIRIEISENDMFSDLDSGHAIDELQYIAFACLHTQNFTENQYKLFNTVFGHQNNSFYTYYTGWYSMVREFNFSANDYWFSNIIASQMYNNQLYQFSQFHVSEEALSLSFSYATLSGDTFGYDAIVRNVYQTKANRIYFTGALISDKDLIRLNSIGAFTYAVEDVDYSFADLFFDIGDTPVVFITHLLDFELFGINFAVAFMGLVSLICMVFLIRKVI